MLMRKSSNLSIIFIIYLKQKINNFIEINFKNMDLALTDAVLLSSSVEDIRVVKEQKLILFEEGTERAGSSDLNHEKRNGSYHCANCGVKLFESENKYESGSGWPSFFQSLPDVFETKTDHLLGYARTEYHCKNCDAHHGHIFDDGPKPTGKRYCNNGVCLVFKPKN